MKTLTLVFGALYGMLSIILGAFGAHALKKILSAEQLSNFETAVRYQMYGAFFLLFVGWILKFNTGAERWISWLMIFGVLMFSGSIYLLSFKDQLGFSPKMIGPVTPIGGLLMIISWGLLAFCFWKSGRTV